MNIRAAAAFSVLLASIPVLSFAQWDTDGVKIVAASSIQNPTAIVADGTGGAIVAWYDNRSGNHNIYVQRVDAWGVAQWTNDGVLICGATGTQDFPAMTTDGAGGVIVAWRDFRAGNADIYAQRVDAAGVPQWTADGVSVCDVIGNQQQCAIVEDGAGGAILAWQDARTDTGDIYARRIDASGVPQWAPGGVAVSIAGADQGAPKLIVDGTGGVIMTWHDGRNLTHYDIYAQRIDASGIAQWTANGTAICALAQNQMEPVLVTDESGGAIITWHDFRGGAGHDIYAQRINAAGAIQWTSNGVVVCTIAGDQYYPRIIKDGTGGADITWVDYRTGISADVYAQRVASNGSVMWAAGGIPVCMAAGEQSSATIAPDGAGGAIVVWQDPRLAGQADIYAQRVSPNGAVQWMADGVKLTGAASDQGAPVVTADGFGGVIMAWFDMRVGVMDVYAQRVDATYGYWGHPEPVVASVADVPNDQGGKVAVNWKASGRDVPLSNAIEFYSVWRAVDIAPLASAAGDPAAAVTPLARITADAAPGLRTMLAGSPYYWELVATQNAFRWPYYSFSASTRADSIAGNPGDTFFMVASHAAADEHTAFMSNVMSGHSVDNLAPEAPLFLTAQRIGANVHLKWNRVRVPDLRDYAIYRATASGVTPVAPNFLASAGDTVAIDSAAPTTTLYYIVTAYDVHQNQSDPSNEASVSATTNVGGAPALTQLTVLQNRPNPFAGATEFEIGLPAAAEVGIEVYDVAGRRVRVQALPRQNAGWQRVGFDGLDDAGRPLVSGVYFCKVMANGATVTRKMVIAR